MQRIDKLTTTQDELSKLYQEEKIKNKMLKKKFKKKKDQNQRLNENLKNLQK